MKKKIITIAGDLGSGKSSTAKAVAKALEYTHYSTGDFARQIAADHGFTITEWNKYAEQNPDLDHQVDKKSQELRESDEVVLDSRIAFHFIPESFKVFLDIDPHVAAERVYSSLHADDARNVEFKAETVESMAQDMEMRLESEKKRYQTLYGVNHHDSKHFDLIIDTGKSENTLEKVIETVLERYRAWLEE